MSIIPLEELEQWYDKEYYIEKVKENPYNLRFVRNQTEEIKQLAVQQDGWVIQYIHNPSKKVQ